MIINEQDLEEIRHSFEQLLLSFSKYEITELEDILVNLLERVNEYLKSSGLHPIIFSIADLLSELIVIFDVNSGELRQSLEFIIGYLEDISDEIRLIDYIQIPEISVFRYDLAKQLEIFINLHSEIYDLELNVEYLSFETYWEDDFIEEMEDIEDYEDY